MPQSLLPAIPQCVDPSIRLLIPYILNVAIPPSLKLPIRQNPLRAHLTLAQRFPQLRPGVDSLRRVCLTDVSSCCRRAVAAQLVGLTKSAEHV